jgi:hypothetical protein
MFSMESTCPFSERSFPFPKRSHEAAGVEFVPAKNGKGVGVRLVRDRR